MDDLLVYVIVVGAIVVFLGQFYFRFKVIKAIRGLSNKNIGLSMKQIASKKHLYREVIAHYPDDEQQIIQAVSMIRMTVIFTSAIILLMTFAFVALMNR